MLSSLRIILLPYCVAACLAFTMPNMGNTVVPPSRKSQDPVARENSKPQQKPEAAIPDPATGPSLVSNPAAPSWMSTAVPHRHVNGASPVAGSGSGQANAEQKMEAASTHQPDSTAEKSQETNDVSPRSPAEDRKGASTPARKSAFSSPVINRVGFDTMSSAGMGGIHQVVNHTPSSDQSTSENAAPTSTRRQAFVNPDPAGFHWGATPVVSSSSRATSVAGASGSMASTLKSSPSKQTTTQRATVMTGTGSLLAKSGSVPSRQSAISAQMMEPKPPQTPPSAAAVSSALNDADSSTDKDQTVEKHEPTMDDVKEQLKASLSALASKIEQAKASLNGLAHKLEESVAKKSTATAQASPSASAADKTTDEALKETKATENNITRKQIEPDVEKINNAWLNVQVGPRVGPRVNPAMLNSASSSATGFVVSSGSNDKNKESTEQELKAASASLQAKVVSGDNNKKPDQVGPEKTATAASETTPNAVSPAEPASIVNEGATAVEIHSSTANTSHDSRKVMNEPHLDAAVTGPEISSKIIAPPTKAAAGRGTKEKAFEDVTRNGDNESPQDKNRQHMDATVTASEMSTKVIASPSKAAAGHSTGIGEGIAVETTRSSTSETNGSLNGKSLMKDESVSLEASTDASVEVSPASAVANSSKAAVAAPLKATATAAFSSPEASASHENKVNGGTTTMANSSEFNGIDESSGKDDSVPELFFAKYVETKVHHEPETPEPTALIETNGMEEPATEAAHHESTNPASAALYHYY